MHVQVSQPRANCLVVQIQNVGRETVDQQPFRSSRRKTVFSQHNQGGKEKENTKSIQQGVGVTAEQQQQFLLLFVCL
ncbi:hypothetical protein L6164_026506 [Bauhinia variegata]|uniref:Uncharacterized protein n=1 Tax=Bauhinia variegata TaxID=167791 RepID=A0ACB9LR06_BAUVA|nr:hypothetical protein L6164_026506 [Bauhinia variegata]